MEEAVGIVLMLLIVAALWVVWFCCARWFFWQFRYISDGIDVLTLGGFVRLKRIKMSDIAHVTVLEKRPFYFYIAPPGTNFMIKLRGPVLVVTVSSGWRYYLTPDDPHAVIHTLGLHQHG